MKPCLSRATMFAAVLALLTAPAATNASEKPEDVAQISLKEVRAKHQLANSQYMDIDGLDIHYVDEGAGSVVVLLHASYHSLRTWDGVAAELAKNHRVVRLDFPGNGLSGFDTKPIPPEKYDLTERNIEVLGTLIDRLELKRFALVGTSSGGTVAFHYASRNTDKVERLALINSAGMPRTPQTNPLRERSATSKWDGMPVRPREFWAVSLGANFIGENTPPDWMIDQAFDFGRKKGLVEHAQNYRFNTGNPKAALAKVEAPTLIIWGMSNPTVMHLEADVFSHWLTSAPSMVIKYPGLGHYPYVEDEELVLPDLKAFIEGELDGKLRQTMRVKVQHSPSE